MKFERFTKGNKNVFNFCFDRRCSEPHQVADGGEVEGYRTNESGTPTVMGPEESGERRVRGKRYSKYCSERKTEVVLKVKRRKESTKSESKPKVKSLQKEP